MGLPNAGKMVLETEAISLLEHLLPRDHIDILRANSERERDIDTFLVINVVGYMHKAIPLAYSVISCFLLRVSIRIRIILHEGCGGELSDSQLYILQLNDII